MIDIITLNKDVYDYSNTDNLSDLKNNKNLCWVRCLNPNDSEINEIKELFDLDSEDVEELYDFLKDGIRPRAVKEDYVKVIYSVPYNDDGDIVTEPIIFLTIKNIVVSVERRKLPLFERVVKMTKKSKHKFMFKMSPIAFISEYIDRINDLFLTNINIISSRTDVITSRNIKLTTNQIDSIFSASTTLAFFNQSIMANLETLNTLRKMHYRNIREKERDLFNDLYHDVLQILDAEKVQREVIMNIFNIQDIIYTNQLNQFMKKMTSLALIVMIPTLITGIYGMNIKGLPFANSNYGFAIVMGFMTVFTICLYLIFKKIDWV